MTVYFVKACAKINIGLRILGKRPDGYHELETIFQSVDLCDEIRVTPSVQGIRVSTTDPAVPEGPENICYRAAQLLLEASGAHKGCTIHIQKKIPTGAGLGGGSSDAAATLLALNTLWKTQLSDIQLLKLALRLGADVPFFLHPGTAIAYGIGEKLDWFPTPWDFVGLVLYPKIPISTKWAYQNLKLDLTNAKKYIKLDRSKVKRLFLREWPLFFKNDFEPLLLGHYPALRDIQNRLFRAGASFVSLSGSGSALFGLFEEDEQVKKALPLFDSHPYKKFIVRPFHEV